ncbi:MAG TPA: C40 family peptidase [Segetibacter sp.]|jgi:cell wall-associated NlpC family hydrolase
MSYIISIVPVTPMRSEPSHRSEQVSQLLFGEVGEVIETSTDFSKVKGLYDAYEGWCQTSQLAEVSEEQAFTKNSLLVREWTREILINNTPIYIPFGSSLSLFKHGMFRGKYHEAFYEGEAFDTTESGFNEEIIKPLAYKYLNTSYLWGGKSVFGVDCSGFCQMVFKFMNIHLHRDAYQQATQGESIGFLQETKCGDLAFFDNEQGKITHVGILLEPSTIIHASGKVRIDSIDNVGIINSETGLRTHNLRLIKRINH